MHIHLYPSGVSRVRVHVFVCYPVSVLWRFNHRGLLVRVVTDKCPKFETLNSSLWIMSGVSRHLYTSAPRGHLPGKLLKRGRAPKLVLIYHCSNRLSQRCDKDWLFGDMSPDQVCLCVSAYRVNISKDHTCRNTCTHNYTCWKVHKVY